MRVVLDECLPKRFKRELPGHEVVTVQEAGWAGVKNGRLLTLIDGAYDAFITVDQNLAAQQNLQDRPFVVVVLRARSNQIADLRPLAPHILVALDSAKPGDIVVL